MAARAAQRAITQVVEHQFLGAAVGDVAGIRGAPRRWLVRRRHITYRQPERRIQGFELLRVAHHQVVVDGDHMHRNAGQRRRGCANGSRQRLALASAHLGQLPIQHHPRGNQLRVERTHTELLHSHRPQQRKSLHGECFAQTVQRKIPAQCERLLAQRHTPQRSILRIQLADRGDEALQSAGAALLRQTEHRAPLPELRAQPVGRWRSALRIGTQQQAGGGERVCAGGRHVVRHRC